MQFDFEGSTPLYQQVAEQIEEGVLGEIYPPDTQVPSTTEIAREFHINPATVLKGMNLLVANKVIEKRRGVGMFVCEGARERITFKRRNSFYEQQVQPLVEEGKRIGLTQSELEALIKRGYEEA